MNILVIDGMGGGIGKSVIEQIRSEGRDVTIAAAGTNSIATSAMLKAGADYGASGENAIVYNCTKADCIIGVMGIVIAHSMHGEISPRIAEAIASSTAHKILIPTDKCNVTVLGVTDRPIQSYIGDINRVLDRLFL